MNSSYDSVPMPTTAEDKLNWEVEKIKVEIANLRKPWIASPASWIALITTVTALTGFIIQYNKSVIDGQLAEVRKVKAQNDTDALEKQKDALNKQKDDLTKQVAGVKVELNLLQASITQATKTLSQMQTKTDSMGSEWKSIGASVDLLAQAQDKLQSLGNSIDDVASNLSKPVEANIVNADKVKIYLQIGRESQRDGAMRIQETLKQKGFTAMQGIENVQGKASVPKITEVRYFSSPTNKEIAETITELLQGQNVGGSVVSKYVRIPGGNKRLIEIWFAPTAFK